MRRGAFFLSTLLLVAGCAGDLEPSQRDAQAEAGSLDDAAIGSDAQVSTGRDADSSPGPVDAALDDDEPAPDAALEPDAGPAGPAVDRSNPRLFDFAFTAAQADDQASVKLGKQLAYLDTRVAPLGKLVVYLHGAGAPATCGSSEHGRVLAAMGFHVLSPCYVSDYGVAKCGARIGDCRLEAFEGIDHHELIEIAKADAIERRVVRALLYLAAMNPEADWAYYLLGDKPKWSQIVISGISHGASSAGLIAMHRLVSRVVMLSGPLDGGQAWLEASATTPIDRFFGFTHTGDEQHAGHLAAFSTLGMSGEPVDVDGESPPYADSHRLKTSAAVANGHNSVEAGSASPKVSEAYLYLPVWRYLYGL